MRRDIRSWLGDADRGSADEAYVTDSPAETLPTPRHRKSKTTLYDSSTSSTSPQSLISLTLFWLFHFHYGGTTITTKPALKKGELLKQGLSPDLFVA